MARIQSGNKPDSETAATTLTSEPAIIEFRCVTKRFGEVVATDRIDLRISAGEFLSLLEWYGKAFANPFAMKALKTSLVVGLWTAFLSTAFGTLAALGLERMHGPVRRLFDGLTYVAIMVPGVVAGIATLIAFVTLFDMINPALAELLGDVAPKLQMGVPTIVAAHVLFNLAVVILIVRSRLAGIDRSLIEASEDLYATPLATFRQVTLPLLMPAIIAGFLLSFTFSFEDFIIAFFVAGPNNTLPIYIFASIRRGITPEINAIGAVVLIVSMTLLILAQFILRVGRSARPPRDQCLNDRQ